MEQSMRYITYLLPLAILLTAPPAVAADLILTPDPAQISASAGAPTLAAADPPASGQGEIITTIETKVETKTVKPGFFSRLTPMQWVGIGIGALALGAVAAGGSGGGGEEPVVPASGGN